MAAPELALAAVHLDHRHVVDRTARRLLSVQGTALVMVSLRGLARTRLAAPRGAALLELQAHPSRPSQPVVDRHGIIARDGHGVIAVDRQGDLIGNLSHSSSIV